MGQCGRVYNLHRWLEIMHFTVWGFLRLLPFFPFKEHFQNHPFFSCPISRLTENRAQFRTTFLRVAMGRNRLHHHLHCVNVKFWKNSFLDFSQVGRNRWWPAATPSILSIHMYARFGQACICSQWREGTKRLLDTAGGFSPLRRKWLGVEIQLSIDPPSSQPYLSGKSWHNPVYLLYTWRLAWLCSYVVFF